MFKLIKADAIKLYEGGGIYPPFLDGIFFVGYVMMVSVLRHYSTEW